MALSERQRRAAREVAKGKSWTQAAISAGYSKKEYSAWTQGHRLSRNVKVLDEVQRLSKMAERKTILSIEQCKEILSQEAQQADRSGDRIKAADTLIKAHGGYIERTEDLTDLRAQLRALVDRLSPDARREVLTLLAGGEMPQEGAGERQ